MPRSGRWRSSSPPPADRNEPLRKRLLASTLAWPAQGAAPAGRTRRRPQEGPGRDGGADQCDRRAGGRSKPRPERRSRIAALQACGAVKSYLKRAGLGRWAGRGEILPALKRLNAKRLARLGGLLRAGDSHQNRSDEEADPQAKIVPKSTIRATGSPTSSAAPSSDAIDGSLASTFRELAGALSAPLRRRRS